MLTPKISIIVFWAYLPPIQPLCAESRDKTIFLANYVFSIPMLPRACNYVKLSRTDFRNNAHAVSMFLLDYFNHSAFRLCLSIIPLTIDLHFINLWVVFKCHAVLALRFLCFLLWVGLMVNGKVPFMLLSMLLNRMCFTFNPLDRSAPRACDSPIFL